MGSLTYCIYMLHYPLIFELVYRLPPPTLLQWADTLGVSLQHQTSRGLMLSFSYLALILPIVVALAWAVERWVERPFVAMTRAVTENI
ncbi:unnamed protein product [Sphagnum balticum]